MVFKYVYELRFKNTHKKYTHSSLENPYKLRVKDYIYIADCTNNAKQYTDNYRYPSHQYTCRVQYSVKEKLRIISVEM